MKRLFLFSGLLVLSLALVSCDDDEGSDFGDIPEVFVGTWNSIEFTASGCTDSEDNGTCSVGCLTILFLEDGAFTGSVAGESILGTATANATTLRLCDPTNDCTDVTYEIGETSTEISWSDDEDGCTYTATIINPVFPDELVGTWTSNSATATGCDDSTDDGTCTEDCLTYTFSANGAFTGTFREESERTGFGYANGSTLNLCWSGDYGCQAVTYSITGNTGDISWTDDEDGCMYEATVNKQ